MIRIQRFETADQPEIKEFVLDIQNNEFSLGLTENDQPDLLGTDHYFANGAFWVAKVNHTVIGTIGFKSIGNGNGVLKKCLLIKTIVGNSWDWHKGCLKP